MPRILLLALLGLWQAAAVATDPTLSLGDAIATAFEPGAVIDLPSEFETSTLRVLVPSASGRLDLQIDEDRPNQRSWSDASGWITEATTREPGGFFPLPDQQLKIAQLPLATWQVRRSNRPFVDVALSTNRGRAPDVEIEQPRGGVLLRSRNSQLPLTISGRIHGSGDYTVAVADRAVHATPGKEGTTFSFEGGLPDAASNWVEVLVERKGSGAKRYLFLRVVVTG